MIEDLNTLGAEIGVKPEDVPETPEEAEIFMDANIKTAAEIAAQLAQTSH